MINLNAMKSKKAQYSAVFFGLMILGIGGIGTSYQKIETKDNPIKTFKINDNTPIQTASAFWPSKYLRTLTFEKIIEKSDLVAIIKISNHGVSYNKGNNLPFTIYDGTVIRTFEGFALVEKINVLQTGGFNEKTQALIKIEGMPILRKGDLWLCFMWKMEYEPNFDMELPENTFKPQPLTSLKLDNNQVHTPEGPKNILPKHLIIENLSLQDFKSKHFDR